MLIYDTSNALLIADVWIPFNALDKVHSALDARGQRSHTQVLSLVEERPIRKEEPPTYIGTNRFTNAFQGIVESFGVAEIIEVNTALFAALTFPFLFVIISGDIGHGLFMFIFATCVVLH